MTAHLLNPSLITGNLSHCGSVVIRKACGEFR